MDVECFDQLWSEADQIWEQRGQEPPFAGYVSADYAAILTSLQSFKQRSIATCPPTFLEWGSGLGVVTIMASQLGFDAYGIEVENELVDTAIDLAKRYGASPTFAVGSFIPTAFSANERLENMLQNTRDDQPAAYEQLDMDLRDFDLVYAYPWPEEHGVFRKIMRRFAAPHTYFLRYDAREGLSWSRPAKHRARQQR